MAKNFIPEICKMLGVELGEEFEIKGRKGLTYKFINDELIVCDDDTEHGYTSANMTLVGLLRGNSEIVKLPWRPKDNEMYYTFSYAYNPRKWQIGYFSWGSASIDIALFKAGWVYRTKEEAEAALPKVAKEMGVEYEI
ncbi:hypothetical protein [uncultured Phascolarctobacterium sp.]|uniref:hypothetical protein n=1 Tax=uncultured Phascolarctobacterium sp. TaxID=512296 RepID=UPI0025F046B5|nr:hypothetical protein [uncultured Phascolarctobacterium sp.]